VISQRVRDLLLLLYYCSESNLTAVINTITISNFGEERGFFFFSPLFTFQMLSQKFPIPSPCRAPLPTHSYFLALAFPCTGAYKVCKTKGTLFSMLHMLLKTRAPGLLLSLCCFATYWVTDPFSSLGTFSSSSIGGAVFHPLMYLPVTGIASLEKSLFHIILLAQKTSLGKWGLEFRVGI
jgi:hypothetical protein